MLLIRRNEEDVCEADSEETIKDNNICYNIIILYFDYFMLN